MVCLPPLHPASEPLCALQRCGRDCHLVGASVRSRSSSLAPSVRVSMCELCGGAGRASRIASEWRRVRRITSDNTGVHHTGMQITFKRLLSILLRRLIANISHGLHQTIPHATSSLRTTSLNAPTHQSIKTSCQHSFNISSCKQTNDSELCLRHSLLDLHDSQNRSIAGLMPLQENSVS
jgi:hypothetical protein